MPEKLWRRHASTRTSLLLASFVKRHAAFHFNPPQTPPETIDFPQATATTRLAGNRFMGSLPRTTKQEKAAKENGVSFDRNRIRIYS